jgi:hypothetical protein
MMPHYAYLKTNLYCPQCAKRLTDMVWFQWGFCPGYAPQKKHIYQLGDAIVWKSCTPGKIPAWTFFHPDAGANIGTPTIKDIVIRDTAQYFLLEACSRCGQRLGGATLEVKDGRIIRAWLARPDEFDDTIEYYIIEADGSLKPMPEWNEQGTFETSDCPEYARFTFL